MSQQPLASPVEEPPSDPGPPRRGEDPPATTAQGPEPEHSGTEGSDAASLATIHIRSAAITGIFVILLFTVLAVARTLFLPLVLALIAQFVLTPAVRRLARLGLPSPVGAAVVLCVVVGTVGGLISLGSDPASRALSDLPHSLSELRQQLRPVREPIAEVVEAVEATEQVASMTGVPDEPAVALSEGPLLQRLLTQTGNVVVAGAVVLVLLYFLLASSDSFLRKVVAVLPTFRDKRRAAVLLGRIESDISHYLVSVTMINIGLGVAVTAALWLLGMPQAPLWGVLAAVCNFVPFLGAVAVAALLTLAAATSLASLTHVALVVGAVALLSSLEGLLVTPALLGRRMTLSPFAVLVSILLWSWLWGIPGAFVAVPMLVVAKALLDAFPGLAPVGALLAREAPEPGPPAHLPEREEPAPA